MYGERDSGTIWDWRCLAAEAITLAAFASEFAMHASASVNATFVRMSSQTDGAHRSRMV